MVVEARLCPKMDENEVRIGVLGGTFDPIHYGHLVIAEETRVRIGLQRVLFVPANTSPLKLTRQMAPADHRCEMIRLAIASNPFFELNLVDLKRPAPSYTVDTLRLLKTELGESAKLYFILGQDALGAILAWHQPAEIIRLCHLVVVSRPGYRVDMDDLERGLPGLRAATSVLESPELAISSTDLRDRVRKGWPIRYQVPDAVMTYIYAHRLYQDDEKAGDHADPTQGHHQAQT